MKGEIHTNKKGLADHVLVDQEMYDGLQAIASKCSPSSTLYRSSILGVNVYIDTCPCEDENETQKHSTR